MKNKEIKKVFVNGVLASVVKEENNNSLPN
mgnify:CR=1 FL=1